MTIQIKPCPHHKRYNPFRIPVPNGVEIKGGCPHCQMRREWAERLRDAGLLIRKVEKERTAA